MWGDDLYTFFSLLSNWIVLRRQLYIRRQKYECKNTYVCNVMRGHWYSSSWQQQQKECATSAADVSLRVTHIIICFYTFAAAPEPWNIGTDIILWCLWALIFSARLILKLKSYWSRKKRRFLGRKIHLKSKKCDLDKLICCEKVDCFKLRI